MRGSVSVSSGRQKRRGSETRPDRRTPGERLSSRRNGVLAAVTAAGVPDSPSFVTTYDLAFGSLGQRAFYDAALDLGYRYVGGGEWPSDATVEDPAGARTLFRDESGGVFVFPSGVIADVYVKHGWLHVHAAAGTRERVRETVDGFAALYPPLYRQETESLTVPITFWTLGRFGPTSRLRMIDAASWDETRGNYTAAVADEIDRLVSPDFEPGANGQLLLWQGPPGTGKTWAIRALASAWAPWAEFSYITDPDSFFVTDPSYMIDVLLHDSYEEFSPDGSVVTTSGGEKWRILVLEDTGELLAADAKAEYGQGLSRLLNVVDGMVGQGLRILVLLTTNDELDDLHPAAVRPGRCASRIEFAPLTAEEGQAWADARGYGVVVAGDATLAELYALRSDGEDALDVDVPEEETSVAADAYVPVVESEDEHLADALRLAREPLPPDPEVSTARVEREEIEEEVADALDVLATEGRPEFLAALQTLAENHRASVEGVSALVASVICGRDEKSDALTQRALDVLSEFARRPDPRQPDVHVHVPEQNVTVAPASVVVNVPEQPAPVANVTVEAAVPAPAPDVHVHVPAAPAQAAPEVVVNVPAAPAPIVNVTAAAPAETPARRIRIEDDPETGSREFVIEPLD